MLPLHVLVGKVLDTVPLRRANPEAREPAFRDVGFDDAVAMVGASTALLDVRYRVDQVAPTDATVLLLGETGTGKGLVARLIHEQSRRRNGRFVQVDCASLPPTLIESELYGHERGAFTDAISTQVGRFELADGGTIFLDEIGELPVHLQGKLLRAIQEGEFERLGSSRTVEVDVRVIAATNRSLPVEVRQGTFRRDLYYRLNVFPIVMPPLRSRRGDIPALSTHIVSRLARQYRKHFEPLTHDILKHLEAYDWPGNVRELENVLERAVIMSPSRRLELAESLETTPELTTEGPELMVDVERTHILHVLEQTRWRIEGTQGAARVLGLRPSTLRSRMHRLGIGRAAGPDSR